MARMSVVRSMLALGVAALVCGCSSSTTGGNGQVSGSSSGPPRSMSGFPATSTAPANASAGHTAVGGTTSSPVPFSTAIVTPPGFVGSWYGHGRRLTVSSSGAVTIDFRTYVNCTARVTTGCDRITGNEIHDGGHVTGRITRVVDATTVYVSVTSTSVPSVVPFGTFRLGHDLRHHAVAPFVGQLNGTPFCGTGAQSGYCGA